MGPTWNAHHTRTHSGSWDTTANSACVRERKRQHFVLLSQSSSFVSMAARRSDNPFDDDDSGANPFASTSSTASSRSRLNSNPFDVSDVPASAAGPPPPNNDEVGTNPIESEESGVSADEAESPTPRWLGYA